MTGAAVCVGVHAHEEPRPPARDARRARATHTGPHELLLLGDGPDAATSRRRCSARGRPRLDRRRAARRRGLLQPARAPTATPTCSSCSRAARSSRPAGSTHLLACARREPGSRPRRARSTNRSWNERGARSRGAAAGARRDDASLEPLAQPRRLLLRGAARGRRRDRRGRRGLWPRPVLGDGLQRPRRARRLPRRVGVRRLVQRLPFTARRAREEAARFDASQPPLPGHLLRPAPARRARRLRAALPRRCVRALRAGRPRADRAAAPASSRPAAPDRRRPRAGRAARQLHHADARPPRASRSGPSRYFQRQDYPERELIVVDDGDDGLERALPDDPRIRYLRAPRGESHRREAQPRLRSAPAASSIAHWDDDDWYAPCAAARADRADRSPARPTSPGLRGRRPRPAALALLDVSAAASTSGCSSSDVHGGTLVYRRRVWERLRATPTARSPRTRAFLWAAIRRERRLRAACRRRPDSSTSATTQNSWAFDVRTTSTRLGAASRAARCRPRTAPSTRARVRRESRRRSRRCRRDLPDADLPTAARFVAAGDRVLPAPGLPDRELLVLDDGADRVEDLVPDDPRDPLRRARRAAARSARSATAPASWPAATLIAHWDDDDWHAPHRLSYQVAELERAGADVVRRGAAALLRARVGAARGCTSSRRRRARWLAGNTLLYRRSLWERSTIRRVSRRRGHALRLERRPAPCRPR